MMQRKSIKYAAYAAAMMLFGLGRAAWSGPKIMPSASPISPKEEVQDLEACRKQALKSMASDPHKKGKELLAACEDRFPGASESTNCKRDALKQFKKSPAKLKMALMQCNQKRKAKSFNATSTVPFTIEGGQLYFAGMGLNVAHGALDAEVGNYSCEPLQTYFTKGVPEFLLFGNNPSVFQGFRGMKHAEIMQKIGVKIKGDKAEQPFQISPSFGQVYDPTNREKVAAYFPISYCYFARKAGPVFKGLKVYYLVDKATKTSLPYFGIAFYQEKTPAKVDEIAAKALEVLGHGYKVQVSEKLYTYIGKSPFKQFDAEGDPYNICKDAKDHEFVVLIRKDAKGKRPDYIATANIRNLCQFGDLLSSSIVKGGK